MRASELAAVCSVCNPPFEPFVNGNSPPFAPFVNGEGLPLSTPDGVEDGSRGVEAEGRYRRTPTSNDPIDPDRVAEASGTWFRFVER